MTDRKIEASTLGFVLFIALAAGYFFSSVPVTRTHLSAPLLAIFFGNGALSLVNIFIDTRAYSINKSHWYFQLIFMVLAPLTQYYSGYYPWGFFLSESDMVSACALVLLSNLSYMLLYYLVFLFVRPGAPAKPSPAIVWTAPAPAVFVCASLACMGAYIALVGVSALFVKTQNYVSLESSMLSFLLQKTLTATPALLCAILILWKREKVAPVSLAPIAVLCAVSLLVNFPTSTTRYWMGSLFLGLALCALGGRLPKTRLFDYTLLAAVIFVFPIFFAFKFATADEVLRRGLVIRQQFTAFNSVDFDAFSMLGRTMQYTREHGFAYGTQLLNVLLFFIPRSLWPGKPLVTSHVVSSAQGAWFTNLSCPLVAEGYVNFGVVGSLLLCLILSALARFLDDRYWSESGGPTLLRVAYPFLSVITLYVSRGPLQPSFIQTLMLIFPAAAVLLIQQLLKKPQ